MNERVEQRVFRSRSSRGNGGTGVRGNRKLIGGGDHTSGTAANEAGDKYNQVRGAGKQHGGCTTHSNFSTSCQYRLGMTQRCVDSSPTLPWTRTIYKSIPVFFTTLAGLFKEATVQDELLVQAVKAVSLANFSNQSRTDHFLIKSRKAYGESLGLLKMALSDGNLTSVSTLAGVLLLNMYDVSCWVPTR